MIVALIAVCSFIRKVIHRMSKGYDVSLDAILQLIIAVEMDGYEEEPRYVPLLHAQLHGRPVSASPILQMHFNT